MVVSEAAKFNVCGNHMLSDGGIPSSCIMST